MDSTETVRASRPRGSPRRILIGFALVAGVLGFGLWFLSSKTSELSGIERYVASVPWYFFPIAVGLELLSLFCYSSVSRSLLKALGFPQRRSFLFFVSGASTALGNAVPLGAAASTVYLYRRLRSRGIASTISVIVITGVNVLTVLSLCLLVVIGAIGAENQAESALSFGTVATVVVVFSLLLFGALNADRVAGLAYRLTKVSDSVRRLLGRPRESPRSARDFTVDLSPMELLVSGAWALLNWIFDLAVLVLMLIATKAKVPVLGVILAYSLGALATNLPITPGGLGVVEGSMTVALVAFGGHEASSIASVILYRLFSYWMILPFGAASHAIYLVLRRSRSSFIDLPTRALSGGDEEGIGG